MDRTLGPKIAFFVILLLVGAFFISSMVVVVDSGHVGVRKTNGKVEEEALLPGLYFVTPVISSITQVDTRVQKYENHTDVYTKDVQQADIAYALNYELDADATVKIYRTVGVDWANKLIPQVVIASLKNVIGQWAAMELISNRLKAQQDIETMISENLKQYGITVSGFAMTNVDFQDQFEKAVEDKVVAVQSAEMAKNKTVEIEEQAKQRVIAAKADAEAMQIKTDALTKNQSLIMYEAVQRWNGQLPQIVGGNSSNLLNLPNTMMK